MNFVNPALLLLLFLMPPAWAWLAARERAGAEALERFASRPLLVRTSRPPHPARDRRRNRLRIGALALAIIALARPQVGEHHTELPGTGRDLLVLLDLSRSMGVSDLAQSRLATAKQAAMDLVTASPGDRIGLIVFGGSAFLQLPLTRDHAAFKLFLDAAASENLYDPSTDVAAALRAARAVFQHEGSRDARAVILLSDGETDEDAVAKAGQELRGDGIPVFALGIGSVVGGPVPADPTEAPEKWHRDRIGRVVTSRLEENALRRAAQETGGSYIRWRQDQGVSELIRRIRLVEARQLDSAGTTGRADRFQWPLALAFLLLMVEGVIGLGTGSPPARRPTRPGESLRAPRSQRGSSIPTGAALACILVVAAGCGAALREARRGVRLYEDSKWSEAYAAFQNAIAAGAGPEVDYNAGNALYRMHRYEQSAQRYRTLSGDSTLLHAAALFNLGNSYVRAAEEADETARDEPLRLAIAAFEGVLRLTPGDSAAKWNLELALRKLGPEEGGGSPGRGRHADYGRGNMDDPGYEGNQEAAVGAMAGGGYGSAEGESAEELSEEQARRLLEAVEREQLKAHEGRPAGRGRPGGRDW